MPTYSKQEKRGRIHRINYLKWIIHSALALSNREISKHWETALPIVSLHSEWPLLHGDSLCSVLNVLNLVRVLFFLRVTDCQCITRILLIPFINYLRYLFDKWRKNNSHSECMFWGYCWQNYSFLSFRASDKSVKVLKLQPIATLVTADLSWLGWVNLSDIRFASCVISPEGTDTSAKKQLMSS